MAEIGAQLKQPFAWRNQPLSRRDGVFGKSMATETRSTKTANAVTGRPRLPLADNAVEETTQLPATAGQRKTHDKSTDSPIRNPTAPKDETASSEAQIARAKQAMDKSLGSSQDGDVQREALAQRERLKRLKECEGLLMANFDWLEMAEYPDNLALAQAKKLRDYWVFALCVLGTLILLGFWGYLPYWVTGGAVGGMVVVLVFGIRAVRNLLFDEPNYAALLEMRKIMEFRALNHIKLLEGKDGLAWRCVELAEYNRVLGKKLFFGYAKLSKSGQLIKHIKSRAHIRLYLLLLLEADKAYQKLKADYFELHHQNQVIGVDDGP